jgi:hypothetical protein
MATTTVALCAAGSARADAPSREAILSPNQIFVRTIQRLESYPVPAYVIDNSTWHIHSDQGETHFADRYATRTSDGMQNTVAYPIGEKLPGALIREQYVGPLAWIVRPVAPRTAAAAALPDVPDLKNIASVTAYRPDYAIDLVGVESIDGHPVYHLVLKPYGDAVAHNLRDLWADTGTFDLWKARFVGTCAPCLGSTEITSQFTPAAGTWMVRQYAFSQRCSMSPYDACQFDVAANNVVFVPALPDWLFDESAYARHMKAQEPDYLATLIHGP